MKSMIINNALLLLPMLTTLSCVSQTNLSNAVSESRNGALNLSYIDSSGKGYEKGLVGGMRMKVMFRNIQFNKQTNFVNVEGLATVFFNERDTIGLCCVDYFIAKPIKGYLTNIIRLGKTNSNQIENASKPDGYFSFEIKLDKDDRLYFVGREGTGLEEYNIGGVCFGVQPIKTKK